MATAVSMTGCYAFIPTTSTTLAATTPVTVSLTLGGTVDLRVGRGFSLNVGGSAARISDQIYLARAGNTDQEVLLQRQALQTGFRITTFIGLRYTFGSIYNTIVNQRFSSLGSSSGRFMFF